jgi:ATP-dependent helicase HrpB
VLLGMNTAVEEAWLREYYPEDFTETREVALDPAQRRVVARVQRRFRDLVLDESQAGEAPADAAARLLAGEVIAGRAVLKNWDADAERWISRVNFVARHWPEYGIAPIGPDERQMLIEQICHGSAGCKEIKDRPVMPTLRDGYRRNRSH